jgi:hypothetical protein
MAKREGLALLIPWMGGFKVFNDFRCCATMSSFYFFAPPKASSLRSKIKIAPLGNP